MNALKSTVHLYYGTRLATGRKEVQIPATTWINPEHYVWGKKPQMNPQCMTVCIGNTQNRQILETEKVLVVDMN